MSISFDRIAERYDATRGFPEAVIPELTDGIVRELQLARGMRALEIGVGTGRIAVPVVSAAEPGLRYIGADISPAMLARLRAKLPPDRHIDLLRADAVRLPFASASLDVMLEVHVLHLVSDAVAVLAEAQRVLRPGGLLVSGYSHHPENSPLVDLRHERWRTILEELGATEAVQQSRKLGREAIIALLHATFGQPREAVLARWDETLTPREALSDLAQRTWSSTWDIPEPLFAEALRRLTSWAEHEFDDLDQPVRSSVQFKLEIYCYP